jgi:hypothetical protein
MSLFPFLGFWLRLIFIYRFNIEKMNKAIKKDQDTEKSKDVKFGAIGFFIILGIIMLYINFIKKS